MSTSTISIDRLSPETITALSIDLGFVPTGIIAPKDEAPAYDAEWLRQFEGQRVRLTITGRKMQVPGRVAIVDDHPTLCTNWGAELDLTHEHVTVVEKKDVDSGRFTPVATI